MLKSSTVFQQAYQKLNPQQKVAVDTIDGSVMVIAGPGTGKTQILAMRIANILLKTDTNPSSILALTFTESAAKNMHERLVQLIGPTAYSVHLQTFHSFAEEVIREHPEFFSIHHESQVLSELERYDLLETLLHNPQLHALRTINSPYHYVKAIIKSISDLKREGVSEKRFVELVEKEAEKFAAEKSELSKTEVVRRERDLAKQQEFSLIYQQYQTSLREKRRYDYDDMIAFVSEAFAKEETLLLEYQERLLYFLVDEYQDTNASQNTVVDLLASFWGERANIFVVGDPHQSIYRFQGASLENTLNFTSRYPSATVITLDIGYRCPPVIYHAAAAVIGNTPLQSVNMLTQKILVYRAPSDPLETIFVAEKIRDLIYEKNVHAHEIAVLYRNNADATDIQQALEKWNIPYVVDGGSDALNHEVLQQFLTLCKVINDLRTATEGHELFEVMNYPWVGLPHLAVMQAARAAGRTKMSLYDRIAKGYVAFTKLQFTENITAIDFALLDDFVSKLTRWGQQDAEMTFPAWFEMVMTESKFLDWLLSQPNKITLLHHLNALFREVKALALQTPTLNLQQFLTAVATMKEHNIQIPVDELKLNDNAVTLSTVHKAKGQEWSHIFLIHCVDGKWGNSRRPNALPMPPGILAHTLNNEKGKDENEDDRRLFYVALTRTKNTITISYPESVVSGNRPKLTRASQFIEEIPTEDKESIEAPEILAKAEEHLAKLLIQPTPHKQSEQEKVWFQQVVNDFKLSATALNAYLRSPLDFVDDYLLKVPRVKPGYQAFGTAVHFALEQLFAYLQKNDKLPTQKMVLDQFEESLRLEILTSEEFDMRLAHGKEMLKKYLTQYKDEFRKPLFVERFFGGGWSKTLLDDIPLSGRIDRVEWVDESKNLVRVIDYKTGRARSLNEIEGKVSIEEFSERELNLPENLRGPYKRQLLFYKLLTQLDKTFPQQVTEGIFDFVEPDRTGRFVQRRVTLTDEDVDALKKLIHEIMVEIRSLKFLEF